MLTQTARTLGPLKHSTVKTVIFETAPTVSYTRNALVGGEWSSASVPS